MVQIAHWVNSGQHPPLEDREEGRWANTARPSMIEEPDLIFLSLSSSVIAGKHCYVKGNAEKKEKEKENAKIEGKGSLEI